MPTSDRYAYIDTPAFVKLCWPEPETRLLESYLSQWPLLVSAALVWTESLRAALRQGRARLADVERRLAVMPVLEVTAPCFGKPAF